MSRGRRRRSGESRGPEVLGGGQIPGGNQTRVLEGRAGSFPGVAAPRHTDSATQCVSRAQDEVPVEPPSPQQNKMDKLIEILNSMRNNSSDVEAKLTTFMEEAQNSTNSEEMLGEIVRTIYQKAVSDRSFAFTAAKLCDKMALFMVEGTKFRSLLLNMLQVTRHRQLPAAPPPGLLLERGLWILTTLNFSQVPPLPD